MSAITDPQAFHVRPRFTLVSTLSVDEICELFRRELEKTDTEYSGKVRHGYVSLFPKPKDKHYWSPHLSISLLESESNPSQTEISGLYGPAPEVWTMFVFFYAILGIMIVIIAVIGFANQAIGESSAILWGIPILVITFGSMYGVSYFGQKKGHDQVEGLYLFMESVLKNK